jgi:DegV family protein with EDD domain
MIKIVTDSTAYLPDSIVRQNDLRVVPLCVHFGDKTYKEGVELSSDEFYTRLKEAPVLPTTSQPSAGEFHEVFTELAAAGHEIVVLTISSRLSGTWNSAMAAREMMPDAKISVVDSLSTSVGLLLLVQAAVNARDAGASREEIVQQVEDIKKKLHVFFVVDTLEYLAKGGRIGNAKAFLGTLLKVKPILFFKDGAIEPLEQVRSKRKAQARMVDLVEECVGGRAPEASIALCHALAPDETAILAKEIQERLGCAAPPITDVGPVIGTHTGPGVIAVAAYK